MDNIRNYTAETKAVVLIDTRDDILHVLEEFDKPVLDTKLIHQKLKTMLIDNQHRLEDLEHELAQDNFILANTMEKIAEISQRRNNGKKEKKV